MNPDYPNDQAQRKRRRRKRRAPREKLPLFMVVWILLIFAVSMVAKWIESASTPPNTPDAAPPTPKSVPEQQ